MNSDNIKLDDIKLSGTTRVIQNKEYIVIGNVMKSGLWIKIKSSDYQYLKPFIGEKDGYQKLMNSLCSDFDKTYFTNIINALAKIQVLERKTQFNNSKLIHSLSLELTTACNLKCKHCSGMYGNQNISVLSKKNFEQSVQWATRNNLDSITLSGGEIFCLPNICEKLVYIHKNFGGNISIITNATLITTNQIETLIETVSEISISLDGYDEKSVDFIRGNGVFKKVIETVKMLQNAGYNNISMSMVLTSDNEEHIIDFKNLCKKLNVKPITRIFSIKGRALDNYDILISSDKKGSEDKVLSNINMLSMCNAGITTLSIDAKGNVTLCPAIEDSNIFMGTVNELNIIANDIKRMSYNCVVDNIFPCNECNVRYFCSSKCYATNLNVFTNPVLRDQRCKQYKKKLQYYVWENKK